MISVKQDFPLQDFERFLGLIGEPGHHDIQIPNRVKSNAVGSAAALIQLIITWARRNNAGEALRLHADNEMDQAARKFAETPFGLVALNMAQRIVSRGGEPLSRRETLNNSLQYVQCMHAGDLSALREYNKSILPVICIDNASKLRRPIRLYRQDTDEVRNRDAFTSLTRNSFRELARIRLEDESSQIEDIASFVYEAFLNTHEHAQTDVEGNRYLRSSRGIVFSFQSSSLERLSSPDAESVALSEYMSGIQLRRDHHTDAHFAEVSVFDSGPGLAQSWLFNVNEATRNSLKSTPQLGGISLEVEYAAVVECFNKGRTTKTSPSRGNGLYRIMQVVKRNGGVIRVRTGRLSLMRAFAEKSSENLTSSDLKLEDISSGETPTEARPWADGCVITVLIPLNRR
ncbi:ATP-binding protein [Falsigemmobacter faecalis]|uniref:Uncharacterized protein n=1 Tax=Falsigemmobacter faecalis TaxID=2488730 RepID=A0A3P3D1I3_9RHOB|nr:hypothetical protein [Falsigemmobacter faecalis]RRH68310.1 hypothetical protein EG244_19660 [Falsigemmobacter faecalis]